MTQFPNRVLLNAGEVPDRSTVSKPKGEKLYTLIKNIRIHHNDKHGRTTKPETVLRGIFLHGTNPFMLSEIPPDMVLAVHLPQEAIDVITKTSLAAQREEVE